MIYVAILSILLFLTACVAIFFAVRYNNELRKKLTDSEQAFAALTQMTLAKEAYRGGQVAALAKTAFQIEMVARDLSTTQHAERIQPYHLDRPIDQCVKAADLIRETIRDQELAV